MSDYTPVYTPGQTVGFTASAAVVGGTLVEVTSSGSVGPAGAASVKALGIAAFDAAAGSRVTVHIGKVVHEVIGATAIVAGDPLQAAANGQVTQYVGTNGAAAFIGYALLSAAAGAKTQYVSR